MEPHAQCENRSICAHTPLFLFLFAFALSLAGLSLEPLSLGPLFRLLSFSLLLFCTQPLPLGCRAALFFFLL